MKSILWILVNCNSVKEAEKIGKAVLTKRLIACYDIVPRLKSAYFWPPKSSKIETTRGAILIGTTLPKNQNKISREVRKLHSDKVPFIGSLGIKAGDDYYKWLKEETA